MSGITKEQRERLWTLAARETHDFHGGCPCKSCVEVCAAIQAALIALDQYEAALKEIAGMDYRGNRSQEMQIAFRALNPTKEDR